MYPLKTKRRFSANSFKFKKKRYNKTDIYGGPEGTSQIVNIGANIHEEMCDVGNFVVNIGANIHD